VNTRAQSGFWAYLKPYLPPFLLAIAFLCAESACDLLLPSLAARLIDRGVMARETQVLWRYGWLMLGVALLGALAATGRNVIASRVSQGMGADLRLGLYRHVMQNSVEAADEVGTAALTVRLTNDVAQVQNLANGLMRIFVKAPLLCVGSVIMTWLISPPLAIILLAAAPVAALIAYAVGRAGFPWFKKTQTALDGLNSVTREYLEGARTVKSFNRYEEEEGRFRERNESLATAQRRAMGIMAFFSPGIALPVNAGIVLALWYGGVEVKAGSVHVGSLVAFSTYATQLLFSLMMLSNILVMFVRSQASYQRIKPLFGDGAETPNADLKNGSQVPSPAISFTGVSYRYPAAAGLSLNEVSFELRKGQTLGVIGGTGSGKTTLAEVAAGLRAPRSGAVIPERSGQGLPAYAPQRPIIFSGTIRENLLWARPGATEEELRRACAIAQADEFIERLPEGYDSLVGRSGVDLSGGQKQRLSLARAVLKNAEVIVIDDSLSALDALTEAIVRKNLREALRDTAVIIISQRLVSTQDADEIIVLKDGRVDGRGRHDDLIKTCTEYRDIYRSQMGGLGDLDE
jgi:ATP-binding cassette subfamily B protein